MPLWQQGGRDCKPQERRRLRSGRSNLIGGREGNGKRLKNEQERLNERERLRGKPPVYPSHEQKERAC